MPEKYNVSHIQKILLYRSMLLKGQLTPTAYVLLIEDANKEEEKRKGKKNGNRT